MRDFAGIWAATPRIVFSSSLDSVDFNSRLVRGDVGTELERARAEFDGDMDVGGATLAASFIRRGLVDSTASSSTQWCWAPERASFRKSRARSRCAAPHEAVRLHMSCTWATTA